MRALPPCCASKPCPAAIEGTMLFQALTKPFEVAPRRASELIRPPGFNEKLVKVPQKAEIFHLSESIPESERDWACPICHKGLVALPHQDRKRVIKYHCEQSHLEHTCRSITGLAKRGKTVQRWCSQNAAQKSPQVSERSFLYSSVYHDAPRKRFHW